MVEYITIWFSTINEIENWDNSDVHESSHDGAMAYNNIKTKIAIYSCNNITAKIRLQLHLEQLTFEHIHCNIATVVTNKSP